MKTPLTLFLCLFCFCGTGRAAVVYVNENASGAGNGSSWTDAYTDLQAAITASVPGDEVWVAAGTYYPTTGTNRTISFVLKNGVKFYGGFNGTETLLAERNPAANPTILSGNIEQTGVATDNAYHVVTAANLSNLTRFDGFKVREGYANASAFVDRYGAGLQISNCSFTVANCFFELGFSDLYGGAVFKKGSGTIVFDSCRFSYNNSNTNGAVYIENSSADFNDCVFSDNQSNDHGAACFVIGASSLVNFRRSRFSNNSSVKLGAAVYQRTGTLNFTRCDFRQNTASIDGGAIAAVEGTDTFTDCIFSGNSAQRFGGVMYIYGDVLYEMQNCLFVGNSSVQGESCIANGGTSFQSNKIFGCTFADNKTAVSNSSSAVLVGGNTSVRNCIFSQNTAVYDFTGYTSVQISHCLAGGSISCPNQSAMLAGNARFVAPGAVAQAPFVLTAAHDYSLKITSPAINAGNNAFAVTTNDLAGNARIFGPKVDLGCFEKNYCALTPQINASGPLAFCSGGNVTLTASGGTGYTWSTGSTASGITVSQAGTFTVTAVDETSGCLGTATTQVTVHALPQPVVTLNSATWTLGTSSFSTYQWYAAGQLIPGATSQTYTPSANGQYSVLVTNANGCEKMSASFTFLNTTGIEETETADWVLYPNPATDKVSMKTGTGFTAGRMEMLDARGRVLLTQNLSTETPQVDLTPFAPGVYLIRLYTSEGKQGVRRLIISR